MAACTYCGYEAGFVRNHHKQCQQNYYNAVENITRRVSDALETSDEFGDLAREITGLAERAHVEPVEISPILFDAWTAKVARHLGEDGISRLVENRLTNFRNHFLRLMYSIENPKRLIIDDLYNQVKSARIIYHYEVSDVYTDDPADNDGKRRQTLLMSERLTP